MSVEKRMIVAVIISAVVIVVWNLVFVPPTVKKPPAEQPAAEGAAEAAPEGAAGSEAIETEKPGEDEGESTATELQRPAEDIVAAAAQSVVIKSPLYEVRLTNDSGGSVANWLLKKPDGKPYRLSFGDGDLDLVAPERYRPAGLQPLATMVRSAEGNYSPLEGRPAITASFPGGEANLSGEESATVTFEYNVAGVGWLRKTLTFHADSYLVDFDFSAEMEKGEPVIIWGPGLGELLKPAGAKVQAGMEGNGFVYRKPGAQVQRFPAHVTEKGEAGRPFKEDRIPEILQWAGVENRYFMALAFAESGRLFNWVYRLSASKTIEDAEGGPTFYYPFLGIKPEKRDSFTLYVGPKDLELLEQPRYGRLKDVVQFGWFSFVSRPALWVMKQINNVTQNYGWSIILLTSTRSRRATAPKPGRTRSGSSTRGSWLSTRRRGSTRWEVACRCCCRYRFSSRSSTCSASPSSCARRRSSSGSRTWRARTLTM